MEKYFILLRVLITDFSAVFLQKFLATSCMMVRFFSPLSSSSNMCVWYGHFGCILHHFHEWKKMWVKKLTKAITFSQSYNLQKLELVGSHNMHEKYAKCMWNIVVQSTITHKRILTSPMQTVKKIVLKKLHNKAKCFPYFTTTIKSVTHRKWDSFLEFWKALIWKLMCIQTL